MPNTRDWEAKKVWQILVYGRSGIGKTFGALTFPRPNLMDFDKGVAVHANVEFIKRYGHIEIEYEQFKEKFTNKVGIPTAHNAFDDACRYFDKWMTPAYRDRFDTWIVDSGTSLSEFAQTKAVILMGNLKLSKTQEQGISEGLIIPKIQDYASERSLVEQFVDMLRDSGKHFIFTCHEKELMNDAGITTGIVPLLTGKSVENIPLRFDEVYNIQIEPRGMERVRTLLTVSNGLRMAKSRYGVPSGIEWTWDSINKALSDARATVEKQRTSDVATAVITHKEM